MSRRRAGRHPLPPVVLVLALLGACAVVLPFVGLGSRVSWSQLVPVLSSPSALSALGLSLRSCVLATAVCVALGVPLALVLSRQWPGVGVARVLVVLPMTMPPVVAGLALLATVGKRGLLGPWLSAHGLQVSFTTTAVVLAQVFVSLPYLVVTVEAALRSRDTQPEVAARTLGAGEATVLRRVTLPSVAPALARGTALALGRSLGEFGATIAFAGSREGVTRTVPLAIYLERENDPQTSLALAVVLIALSFAVVGATTLPFSLPLPRPPRDRALFPTRPGVVLHETGRSSPRDRVPAGRSVHLSFSNAERGVNLQLDVEAGGTLALVGPNGSGKSTACAVLAGLLDAGSGSVRVGERVVDGGTPGTPFVPAGRRGVALLSQGPGLLTHLSVLDNVAFGPRCLGASRAASRARATAELDAVGASHLAGRPASRLSGGQTARVALARALATDPAVLVLDEPMAALDVTARQDVRQLIARRVAEEGLTLVLVTHDVLDLTTLADEVVVLEDGRVVETGPTTEVLSTPTSRFGAHLAGMSVLTGTAEGDDDAPVLRLTTGERLATRPGQEGRPRSGPAAALVPPDAVALYPFPPSAHAGGAHGSPRNTLPAAVTGLERSGGLVTVALSLADGAALSAVVTAGAVAELGLGAGSRVLAVVKAVQVRTVPLRTAPPGRATATPGEAASAPTGTAPQEVS